MANNNQDNRLLWVDYAKGIGVSLVVVQHILGGILRSNIGSFDGIYFYYDGVIEIFHMEVFFFLSGLFVLKSIEKREWFSFLTNKTRTLLYPYFLWSLIYAVIFLLIPNSSNRLSLNVTEVTQIWYQPIFHFWFLHSLFICQALFLCFYRNELSRILLLVISVILYFFSRELVLLDQFNDYLIFFMLGVFSQGLFNEQKKFFSKNTTWLVLSLLSWELLYVIRQLYFSNCILTFFASVSAILFAVSLSFAMAQKNLFSFIRIIGFYSLPIYLVHYITGTAVRTILLKLHVSQAWIHVPVGLLAAFIVPVILYRICEKIRFRYLF